MLFHDFSRHYWFYNFLLLLCIWNQARARLQSWNIWIELDLQVWLCEKEEGFCRILDFQCQNARNVFCCFYKSRHNSEGSQFLYWCVWVSNRQQSKNLIMRHAFSLDFDSLTLNSGEHGLEIINCDITKDLYFLWFDIQTEYYYHNYHLFRINVY